MNFAEVPVEIWKQVLYHFDEKELKKILSVSEEFRRLIIETPRLMRKLPVILYRNNWRIEIPFIEENGSFVRAIKFHSCGFRHFCDFKTILSLTPNVESLTLDWLHFVDDKGNKVENEIMKYSEVVKNGTESGKFKNDMDEPIELKKLQHVDLELNGTVKFATVILTCTTLKTLKINFGYKNRPDYIFKFIFQQKNLQELSLIGAYDEIHSDIFKDDFSDQIQFKLKKLKLDRYIHYHPNFFKFLKTQTKYLEHLELPRYLDFQYHKLILNECQNLKTLSTPFGWIGKQNTSEIKHYRNPSVKELTVTANYDYSTDDFEAFKTFLHIFPNIEKLSCNDISQFSMEGILDNFNNLREIKTGGF
jgi:hypothetical protein